MFSKVASSVPGLNICRYGSSYTKQEHNKTNSHFVDLGGVRRERGAGAETTFRVSCFVNDNEIVDECVFLLSQAKTFDIFRVRSVKNIHLIMYVLVCRGIQSSCALA